MDNKKKVILGFTIIAIIAIALEIIGFIFTEKVNEQTIHIADKMYQNSSKVQHASILIMNIHLDIWDAMLFEPIDRGKKIDKLDEEGIDFYQTMDFLIENNLSKEAKIVELKEDFKSYYMFGKRILDYPDLKTFYERPDTITRFNFYKRELIGSLDNLSHNMEEELSNDLKKNHAYSHYVGLIKGLATLLELVITLIIIIYVLNATIKPIKVLKERLSLALKGSELGTWDWDIVTGKVILDEQCMHLFGYDEKYTGEIEHTFEFWNNKINPDEIDFINEKLEKHFSGEDPVFEMQHQIKTRSGSYKWVMNTGKVVERDKDGNPVRMVGTHKDITEKKKMEDIIQQKTENLANALIEMKKAKEQADHSNQLKSQFLASMSHELRTPLNIIIGYSEELLQNNILGHLTNFNEDKYSRPACKEHLIMMTKSLSEFGSYIHNSGKHLLMLINDILDLSKIEAGRLTLHKSYFDIESVIINIKNMFMKMFNEKKLNLVIEIDSKIEEYWGDEDRIAQILINLLSNAIKFTESGGFITLRTEKLSGEILFEVRDDGLGIEKEKQKIIFDRFRQVDGTDRRKFGGTGLGLAISKNLVKMHSGRIWVESEVGEGSSFYFTIPNKMEENEDNGKNTQDTLYRG